MRKYDILEKINYPSDLKLLDEQKVLSLNSEIRDFLVENVTETGGHLASNLGVVELTVALHRVFSAPYDRIIWDVGHQTYVHKLLTGRRERFSELRTPGGLSGFTKPSESEYDPFGAGHSSTSLSAALGFAKADRLAGRDNYTIAVLGDGAYTGGMIHEALNNCEKNLKLIIILNENEMSISKNIGSFARYIARVRTSKKYIKAKRNTTRFIKKIPLVGSSLFEGIKKVKKGVKNIMYGSNYFEELGLFYIGPADGNDYFKVEELLRAAVSQGESVIIHLKTQKGRGYPAAEAEPDKFHCIKPSAAKQTGRNFSSAFGEKLCELAENNEKVCAITAAMASGTGLELFKESFAERFFDVGIAEEHAITFSAGLAAAGMKPFIALYSSFLQRGYDNIVHDVALQNLPVVLCIDRAGLSMGDGATHHGIFDVSFVSAIPGVEIFAPISFDSLSKSMEYAAKAEHPVAIRYPNDTDTDLNDIFNTVADGSVLPVCADFSTNDAPDFVIVTYGTIVFEALKAKKMLEQDGVKCGIVLAQHLKPYCSTASEIEKLIPDGVKKIIFLEEGIKNGGAAMILSSILAERGKYCSKIKIMAIDDDFVAPTQRVLSLYDYAGISAECVYKEIRTEIENRNGKL